MLGIRGQQQGPAVVDQVLQFSEGRPTWGIHLAHPQDHDLIILG